MIRVLVFEEPAECGDHCASAGRPVPGGQVRDEAVQPARGVSQPDGQVGGLDKGPFRAALPAGRHAEQPRRNRNPPSRRRLNINALVKSCSGGHPSRRRRSVLGLDPSPVMALRPGSAAAALPPGADEI
jgi:hypothetical protein